MLDHLHSILRAKGFKTHMVKAGEPAPMDQIVVEIEPDEKGRERSLWLTPLPDLEETLEVGLSLLQLLATLPFPPGMRTESELHKRILQLNNKLPVGGFGFREPDEVIFYRHVLVLGPDQAINGAVVSETIGLMSFLLDQFSSELEDAAGH